MMMREVPDEEFERLCREGRVRGGRAERPSAEAAPAPPHQVDRRWKRLSAIDVYEIIKHNASTWGDARGLAGGPEDE